ncbi:VOC family protein [Rhodovulum steppense]|uniref:Extradiol dioxygenase family protein n=1 Tax=Rhodovulum steppense TaxID=540251 RepID=A0A4R1YX31_9RHOB|nr:VOC family protein [Rhodovulum steppense]TCM85762.1 extradiol dioxygenase family protein [Rhodovulum steppense]
MFPHALHHVQLAMPAGGEAQARAFYGDLLGLDEDARPFGAVGGVWFQRGELRIHLGVEPDFRPARKAHPALMVRKLDALAERLERAGLDLHWDDRVPGLRRFFIDDPFGNRIELVQGAV